MPGLDTGEGRYASADGTEIFHRWRVPADPRAVLLVVHGFNSHSGQYEAAVERFADAGLAVHALDLRGRGRSAGERFYVEHFDDYLADVRGLHDHARARHAGLPVFIFGHSAGGVVATTYAARWQNQLAGLVCESFAYRVFAPAPAVAVLKGLSHVAPHLGGFALHNKDFSRDPEAVARLNADPLIHHETQPTKTAVVLVNAADALTDTFATITLPLLILHGTADKATKPEGSETFHRLAGSPDKTLKLYDGHYHDLLQDYGKEQVLDDIAAWLQARLPPAEPAAA